MKQYEVTGMSCAACSARVEKAVSKVPGVTSCSVSLLTNSMGVEGTATDQEIVNAVVAAGYGAAPKGAKKEQTAAEEEEALKDHETPKLRKRLIASVIFLVVLMYFSMGHMMWGWPVPAAMKDNHVAMGMLQMLLTIIIMVINQKFFVSGFTSLLHGAPNMDTLVALGAGASFGYSTYALFAMTGAQVRGDMDAVMGYMHEFYFESAAMILTLITVGKMLESHAKGKTTDALKSLMRLAPKTATVVRDGKEVIVSITEVRQGDTFVVRPGENIPVDGIVRSTRQHSPARVFPSINRKVPLSVRQPRTSPDFCAARQPVWARIRRFPRSLKWYRMQRRPKPQLQKLRIKYPVFLFRPLSPLQ